MDPIDFIKEVETKYNVKSVKVKGLQVWPFLRTAYFMAYSNSIFGKYKKISLLTSLRVRIECLKSSFYCFWNLFKKYDYFVFSNIWEERQLKGKYINKLLHGLITELGEERLLLIENPLNKYHISRRKIAISNIISMDLFRFLCYLVSLRKSPKIHNEKILKEINEKYGLNIIYNKLILEFFSYKKLFNFFFHIYKPELIFLSNYYGIAHQAVIFVAKKMGIKTIEFQHGRIDKQHPAYNIFIELDKSFFPDYLFAFGNYVKDVFDKRNYFIKKENVFPVGSMYIDYIKNQYRSSANTIKIFEEFKKKYKKMVAVSSQISFEDKLIDFLKKAASLYKDILYIYVPRDLDKDYSNVNFPENIIILKDLNVYQIIKEVDFHSTICSTCALEAPALGVPNILINIKNWSTKYYSNILLDQNVTRYVNKEEEFVSMILNWIPLPKEKIIRLHSKFYKPSHRENLKEALKNIRNSKLSTILS